jgi:branched-chain amino acid transport system substrate-binding protein
LLGKQIQILEFDNQGTTLGSKLAAQKAVEARVIGVIGAYWSSHSLAMASVFQEAHIPMISPYSTNPNVRLTGEYIFRACFTDSFQGAVMANFAFQDFNARSAIVVTQKADPFSKGLGQYFTAQFMQSGGEILWKGSYMRGATDFSEIIAQIARLKPDVIFASGYPRESAFIIRHARNLGVSTLFLGGDGWDIEMLEYGGEAVNESYYSDHWHRDSVLEKSRQFVEKFEQSPYSEQIETNAGGLTLTYDAMHLFAAAVRRANSFDPAQIRAALAATKDFQGVTGRITFDQHGDPVNKSAVILKFEQGALVYVKTVEP